VDAIVLAGGLSNGLEEEAAEWPNEALIPIGSRPMIDYVVAALRQTAAIDRIVVAGPIAELNRVLGEQPGLLLAEGGATAIQTLQLGLRRLFPEGIQPHTPQWVLVATADIPLLTVAAVQNFLELCRKRAGDLYYPIVSREQNETHYPGVKRTYVMLREGAFTGGNLVLVDGRVIAPCAQLAEQIVARRKNPLALSWLLGLGFVIRFLLRRLSIAEVESKASRLLGIRGVAVVSGYPEIGVDVDKPSDLLLVRRILAGQQ